MRLHKDDDTAIVVHRKKRIVWFQGSITKQTGLCVGKALRVLNRNCKKPILFYLFSTGGEVGGERLIVRAIKNSSAPIIMIGHRRIASAALTVFQGGVQRYALPRTKFKFHQTRAILTVCPKHRMLQMSANECLSLFHNIKKDDLFSLQELSRHMSVKQAERLLAEEATISVAHAIRLGMIDGYLDKRDFKHDQRIIARMYHKARSGRPR